MKRRSIQRNIGARAGLLMLLLLSCVLAGPGCNIFNDLGNAWGTGTPPNLCGGMGGQGGGGGGDGGGGNPGAGGSPAEGANAGAGGSDVGSAGAGGGGARRPWPTHRFNPYVWPAHRIRRHRARIGTAFEADCPDMGGDPGLPMMAPKIPLLDPLTTTRLRAIAVANGYGAGHTGIQFNRDVGLAFQTWVLWMLEEEENKTLYTSALRMNANNGLPASVVPDYVAELKLVTLGLGNTGFKPLLDSRFGEMKAVNGNLTPATKQSQILGFIDVAAHSPASMSTAPHHPPSMLEFTTTGDTMLDKSVGAEATNRGVAVWHQVVFVDATIPNDPNPELYIGPLVPVNPEVYTTVNVQQVDPSGKHAKLTAPKTQLTPVPGDPDPPEVE